MPCAEFGDQHLDAFGVAARLVVGAHDQHTGEFAVCAGCGLQRHGSEAADFLQPFLQGVHQGQVALDGFDGLQRMGEQETRQAAGVFVDLGVVLHRARAKRIEAAIHAVVEGAQVHVMTDHVHFGQFGQGQVRSQHGIRQFGSGARPVPGKRRRCVRGRKDQRWSVQPLWVQRSKLPQSWATSAKTSTSASISSLLFISVTAISMWSLSAG